MKKLNSKLEPQLDLNKNQVLKLIESYVLKNDPNELFVHILNSLMKAERTDFLEQKANPKNKGNGYRTVKKAGMFGQLELLIPRDRLGTFKPIIQAILNKQEEKIKDLSYALYAKGLTTLQVSDILEDIYGRSYSKTTVSRISNTFYTDIEKWLERELDPTYLMMMVDAIHIKVKRDKVATEAFYIVLGMNKNYKREIIAVINEPTESAAGWKEVLEKIKERGVKKIGLFVSDDLKGLDTSISQVFPESDHQKCVVHFKRNLLRKLRREHRGKFADKLKEVFNLENPPNSIQEALERLKEVLQEEKKLYKSFAHILKRDDLHLYFTYLKYDVSIRRMIYTTNWLERFNKSIRRTIKIRNSLPSINAALLLIGSVAIDAENGAFNYKISKFENDMKMNQLANE